MHHQHYTSHHRHCHPHHLLNRNYHLNSHRNCHHHHLKTLEECLVILAQPKKYGRARAKPPLRELGTDPHSGKPILLKDGQFGPYVTDGETNASLRRGDSVEELSDGRAAELLAERRAKGPARKPPRRKS